MEDTDDEIDFANLIELFDSSYYDEEYPVDEHLSFPKVDHTQF